MGRRLASYGPVRHESPDTDHQYRAYGTVLESGNAGRKMNGAHSQGWSTSIPGRTDPLAGRTERFWKAAEMRTPLGRAKVYSTLFVDDTEALAIPVLSGHAGVGSLGERDNGATSGALQAPKASLGYAPSHYRKRMTAEPLSELIARAPQQAPVPVKTSRIIASARIEDCLWNDFAHRRSTIRERLR